MKGKGREKKRGSEEEGRELRGRRAGRWAGARQKVNRVSNFNNRPDRTLSQHTDPCRYFFEQLSRIFSSEGTWIWEEDT
jgi:hypothetical protein